MVMWEDMEGVKKDGNEKTQDKCRKKPSGETKGCAEEEDDDQTAVKGEDQLAPYVSCISCMVLLVVVGVCSSSSSPFSADSP